MKLKICEMIMPVSLRTWMPVLIMGVARWHHEMKEAAVSGIEMFSGI
jgi:hypothetical protein